MNWDFLKGASNQSPDSARILFFIGGLAAIFAPIGFQVWAMIRHQPWDATSFCLAYGGLLTGYILGGCFGISNKDKGVAKANAINADAPTPSK